MTIDWRPSSSFDPIQVYRLQPIDEPKDRSNWFSCDDIDGIKSNQPIRIVLSAVNDQPPQPIVRLNGIGSAITPQARLPFHRRR